MKRKLNDQWKRAFTEGGGRFAWADGFGEAKNWVKLLEGDDGNGVLESSFEGDFGKGTWEVKGDDGDIVVMTFGRAHHHCRLHPNTAKLVFTAEKFNRKSDDKMPCRVRGWPDVGLDANATLKMTKEAFQVLLSCTKIRPRPVRNTMVYEHAVDYEHERSFETILQVTQEDSLVAAKRLCDLRDADDVTRPLVLNMANDHHPGGGFLEGKGGQEEDICRRSTLYCELCDASDKYPLTGSKMLICPEVVVFRGEDPCSPEIPSSEHFRIAVISAAAPFKPKLSEDGTDYRHAVDRDLMREKIKALLSISASAGYSRLVLSAWGCGAYRNPPKQVATLFREAVHASGKAFEHVVFAIADRTTHRGTDNNYADFRHAFKDLLPEASGSDA